MLLMCGHLRVGLFGGENLGALVSEKESESRMESSSDWVRCGGGVVVFGDDEGILRGEGEGSGTRV